MQRFVIEGINSSALKRTFYQHGESGHIILNAFSIPEPMPNPRTRMLWMEIMLDGVQKVWGLGPRRVIFHSNGNSSRFVLLCIK
jgi:hypothetical protein